MLFLTLKKEKKGQVNKKKFLSLLPCGLCLSVSFSTDRVPNVCVWFCGYSSWSVWISIRCLTLFHVFLSVFFLHNLPSFCLPCTVQGRTEEFISHTASSIASSRLIDWPPKNRREAERQIESQRRDLSHQSPRAMLQEDGPHPFALALKFPLIHRKQTQSKENKQPLSHSNSEDEAAFVFTFHKITMKIKQAA